MKQILLTIVASLLFLSLSAQHIEEYDTVYNLGYYKAYYSESIQTSSFVIYKLYKPTSKVSRKGLDFKAYNNLPHFNYSHSGYDKGHLVPAADLSQSKQALVSTFYYINAVPQTPELNRGSWKALETTIRNLSQTDSLLIVCGGCDYLPQNPLIPTNCFKVVYSLTTSEPVAYYIFSNDKEATQTQLQNLLMLFPCDRIKELYIGE